MSANIALDIKLKGKVVESRIDTKLCETIKKFVDLKKVIEAQEKELKALKDEIVHEAKEFLKDKEEATVTFDVLDDSVKVAFAWDMSIVNEAQLMEILGARFDDLVKTKISYSPTENLKEMINADDGLKECIKIKEKAPAVTINR